LNGNEFIFDLSDKDQGIYIVEINCPSGITREKLIKY
jgi:hypothetical protein